MNKQELFYIETVHGCGIRAAANIDEAERNLDKEVGSDNWDVCEPATEGDISWVRSMGGCIPAVQTPGA